MKKKVIIILLILLALLGLGIVFYIFFYQPKPTVVDETNGKNQSESDVSGGDDRENEAVINENVHIYMDGEAEAINQLISSVEYTNGEILLYFPENTESEFTTLGSGEIFWLDGNETTPLRETYIGKIRSNITENGQKILSVESPALNEVFDVFYLNDEYQFDASQIRNISTIDGVEITPVDYIPRDFMKTANHEGEKGVSDLVHRTEKQIETAQHASQSEAAIPGFIVNIDVDLIDLLNVLPDEENTEEGIFDGEMSCKLTGKMGMEDVSIFYNADVNLLDYGIKELSVGVKASQVVKADLKVALEGEISGKETEKDIGSVIKLQGLDEKVFPIAYFECTTGHIVKLTGSGQALNEKLQNRYKTIPVSIGFMVYMDIYGNLSIEFSGNYDYTNEIENKVVFVENNQLKGTFEGASDPKKNYSVTLEAKADADLHMGASILLYFFNINAADVSLVKFGTEAEGTVGYTVSSNKEENNGFEGTGYARLYLKLFNARIKLKGKAELWGISGGGMLEFDKTLIDMTLAETGQKKDTHFNAGTMKWKQMTAQDDKYYYYKSSNGKLYRQTWDGWNRKIIYEEDFFEICGVDQSYIYVLQATEDEKYNLRRISKDGETSKIILKDVKYVLLFEDDDIFFVPSDQTDTIMCFNRNTLEKKKFKSYENNVEYMCEKGDGYFIVTNEPDDAFAWLMGPTCIYYDISKTGEITGEYHSDILPQQGVIESIGNYKVGYKLLTNGYLRETADAVYWMPKDMSSFVEVEGCSGWRPTEAGIFTEMPTENGMYQILLCRAETGNQEVITTVHNAQSMFTLSQDRRGNWYYMDQTDTHLELYRMGQNFENKTLVVQMELDEVPCNMEECSMEIVANKLIFFTMPEWSESKVLYRYDLYE